MDQRITYLTSRNKRALNIEILIVNLLLILYFMLAIICLRAMLIAQAFAKVIAQYHHIPQQLLTGK